MGEPDQQRGRSKDFSDPSLEGTLRPFREIAAKCTEEECIAIIADCAEDRDPVIRGPVKGLYEDRLFYLIAVRRESDYYESRYGRDNLP